MASTADASGDLGIRRLDDAGVDGVHAGHRPRRAPRALALGSHRPFVSEVPLAGGDLNVVVRVGDTVRRPAGPPGVRALLEWFEHVGFDGAPRFLGFDDRGREILSYVEGDPAFAPVPA